MKAGEIVEIQPHIDIHVTRTLFDKPAVGIIKSTLNNDGYYDVLLLDGRVLFLCGKNLKVVGKSS